MCVAETQEGSQSLEQSITSGVSSYTHTVKKDMEDSIDTAALSRIYELKDDCDYIMMKSTIIKE
jgi:hypothetical protein